MLNDPDLDETSTAGSEHEKNKKIALQYMDAIDRGDSETQLSLLAEDVVITVTGSTLASGIYDKKFLAGVLKDMAQSLPDGFRLTVHNVIAEGNAVAVEAESLGNHISGKIYNNAYHFLLRMKDGLISEIKEYCDTEHVTDVLCGGQRPTS